mgnify:CR=1 FL=1
MHARFDDVDRISRHPLRRASDSAREHHSRLIGIQHKPQAIVDWTEAFKGTADKSSTPGTASAFFTTWSSEKQ